MIFDVHTHTGRYSSCSAISLEELILAERMNADGIVVTDHDHLMDEKEGEYLSRKYEFIVLPGVEISAQGVYAHILAFGIKREIGPDMGVEETLARIHEQGGVAVAAHPLRYVDELDRSVWKGLDAIETLNPHCSQEQNMKAREIACDWGLPQIGSSDVHNSSMVGTYATRFSSSITNMNRLKEAILNGEAEPIAFRRARRGF